MARALQRGGFRPTKPPILGCSRPTLGTRSAVHPNAFQRGESDCNLDTCTSTAAQPRQGGSLRQQSVTGSRAARFNAPATALGGPVQASRCREMDTESHAALRSLTLQPPELLPQLGEPVRRRSSSRRPKAGNRPPSPPIVFPCSGARISLFDRRNSLFDAREFPVPLRREFGP